ncbi:MAG: cation transporting ATPase C-terminal domain-containing protein, partial [Eubacteriaceae bacterium]
DFAVKSVKRLLKDKVMRIISICTIAVTLIILYTPLNAFLRLAPLSFAQFILAVAIAAVSVFWYEIIKLMKKIKQ